jgi:hypothetical protein
MLLTQSDIDRFWAKVNKDGPIPPHRPELGPCWVWTAGTVDAGYGGFWLCGKMRRAQRVAFLIKHGRWPEPCACHRCDNPPCVREDHLFEGTHAANARDRDAKGRQVTLRGAEHWSRYHPELLPRGDRNGARRHPERLARGDRSGRRLHPERYPRGERVCTAKLTEADVLEIRRLGGTMSQRAIAEAYGVTRPLVGYILQRTIWRHVA